MTYDPKTDNSGDIMREALANLNRDSSANPARPTKDPVVRAIRHLNAPVHEQISANRPAGWALEKD